VRRRVGFFKVLAEFLFFSLRGVILWLIFPTGFCMWLVLRVLGPRRNRDLQPGMVIGWLDGNLVAGLTRLLPIPAMGQFEPWSLVRTHRRPSFADAM